MQSNPSPRQKAIVHHPLPLIAILLLGLALRFWHLDTKPLWLDEVLTALFTMGRRFSDVPLNQFFSLAAIDQLFTLQPGRSCAQIAHTVATESVHPPLFFCLMYQWLSWLNPDADHWIWALRSLPALMGVGAIAAVYSLNRLAFSARAALLSAALMAVSPFAVYLSQEARHYTLPMLLITLELIALLQIQRDLLKPDRLRPVVWIGWTGLNLLSLYVHYFCGLAVVAQIGALAGWLIWQRQRLSARQLGAAAFAVGGVAIGFLPWLPTFLSHIQRPETDWLIPYNPDWLDRLAPLYQTLVGWTLMFVALPVEKQPLPIAIVSGGVMLGFMLWLAWQFHKSLPFLWQQVANRPPFVLLLGFIVCVIAEFLLIAYGLNKDLTVVPRYNFVYYPAVCAIVGASLAAGSVSRKPLSFVPFRSFVPLVALLMGIVSSVLVVNGFVFLKSYNPDRVAKNLRFEPIPIALAVSYESPQEVALGLSFVLALRQNYPSVANAPVQAAFLDKSAGYRQVWKTLAQLPQPLPLPLNLWVIASPGMRSADYPRQLRLSYSTPAGKAARTRCPIDPDRYHRVGFPYQLFRCTAVDPANRS
ncbi:glycosyltransferase family 39 protein [Phormidium tenue FACHB-886]|nr:glycosyltransferase family 39 protein [Phormidium tenue FACHB-886]